MTRHGALSLVIRRAKAEDYDQILVLWREAGTEVSGDGRDSRNAFSRQLGHFPDTYLVATDGGRIVGVVLGTHDWRKGWINRLAVLPEYRQGGLASKLVRACEEAIRGLGIEIVTALVEPANTASVKLFQKLGYRTDVPVRYFRKLSREGA